MTPDLQAAVNGIGLDDEQIRTMPLSEPTPHGRATEGDELHDAPRAA